MRVEDGSHRGRFTNSLEVSEILRDAENVDRAKDSLTCLQPPNHGAFKMRCQQITISNKGAGEYIATEKLTSTPCSLS